MALLVGASFSVAATPRFAYSANYFGSSISIFQVDAGTGMLRHLSHVPTVKSPSTVLLHPSGSFLYAVSQVTDEIAIYRVDADSGALHEIVDSPIATGVRSSFQLAVSPDGRLLYVPGRFSQNLMVFRIDPQSGALSALEDNDFPTHGDRARFISTTPDGRNVYIGNTFANTMAAYRVDSERESLTPVEGMPFKTGDAPQAIMVHPSGKYLYVANWRDGTVSAMQIDPASGVLSPIPGKSVEAGIWPFAGQVHPSGQYLYVANYGSSDISGFQIDPNTGALSALPGMPAATGGEAPFTVQLDAAGRHAYAPNYNSMDVTVFDVQQASGQLVNPRLLYGRPGVRKIEILEGEVPVTRTARWLLLAEAERPSISSFSMDERGEPQQQHTLPLKETARDLALHPDGGWAFVSQPAARRIEVLRIAADGTLNQAPLAIALEGTPRDLRVDARGRHLYAITQAPNQYLVFRLDMEKGDIQEVEKLTLPADSRPQRLAATPEERLSFVLDDSGNRTFAYRYLDTDGPLSYELTRHGSPFALAPGPADLAVDPTGRYGLVVSTEAASVTSYSMPGRWGPLKAVQGGTLKVGQRPLALSISPNGRDVYVLDAGTPQIHLLQLDGRDGSLRENAPAVPLKAPPTELVIDPSGRFVYIRYASRSGLTRFEVDVAQGRLIHPTEVLSETVPSALAFSATIQ